MDIFSFVSGKTLWKTLKNFVLLFTLSVLVRTLMRHSEVLFTMKNPVLWLMAGLGTLGYWWSLRTGDEEQLSILRQK